jgi:hypothetical protein
VRTLRFARFFPQSGEGLNPRRAAELTNNIGTVFDVKLTRLELVGKVYLTSSIFYVTICTTQEPAT